MNKYIDLLNELKNFTQEQLHCEIKILCEGDLTEKSLEIVISDDPLYLFTDTNMESYCDFESEENSVEYNCEKLFTKSREL